MPVHKTDKLEEDFVRSALGQTGMKDPDIKIFIDLHSVPDSD